MVQQQLRWKGSPAPRGTQIPPEEWEVQREEICALHEKMKLEDVIVMMKVQHCFSPSYVLSQKHKSLLRETKLNSASRRQYIFQLEKWAVQKYNKRREAPADEVQPRDRPPGYTSGDKVGCDVSGTGMRQRVYKQNSGVWVKGNS